jgi:hypothetical protein
MATSISEVHAAFIFRVNSERGREGLLDKLSSFTPFHNELSNFLHNADVEGKNFLRNVGKNLQVDRTSCPRTLIFVHDAVKPSHHTSFNTSGRYELRAYSMS